MEEKDSVELVGMVISEIEITDETVEMTITGENYDSLHPEIREFIEGHRKLAKTQENSRTHGVDVKIGANIESLT